MLCFVVQNILPLIEITVPGFEKTNIYSVSFVKSIVSFWNGKIVKKLNGLLPDLIEYKVKHF